MPGRRPASSGIGECEGRGLEIAIPGVESCKCFGILVEVIGGGWPRLCAAIAGIADIAVVARDRKTKSSHWGEIG